MFPQMHGSEFRDEPPPSPTTGGTTILFWIGLDILAGLSVVAILGFVRIFWNFGYDWREAFGITAFLFLIVGFVRGHTSPRNAWVKSFCVVAIGAIAAYRVLGLSLGFASVLFLTSYSLARCGIAARRAWSSSFRRRGALLLFVPVMLVVITMAAGSSMTRRLQERYPYSLAPTFSFSTLDGKIVTSAELKDHVVVLGFWATWCYPCVQELPLLEKIHERYKENPSVVFWAVDLGDAPDGIRALLQLKGYRMPVSYDLDHSAARRFRIDRIPFVLVLDKAGRTRLAHFGYQQSFDLVSVVSEKVDILLRETN